MDQNNEAFGFCLRLAGAITQQADTVASFHDALLRSILHRIPADVPDGRCRDHGLKVRIPGQKTGMKFLFHAQTHKQIKFQRHPQLERTVTPAD